MILPDTNLLLYATVDSFHNHESAHGRWQRTLSSGEPVALVAPVVFAFLRLTTSTRVLARPMTVEQSTGLVDQWLQRSVTRFLPTDRRHLTTALSLMRQTGAAWNLTTDAQIAAHALVDGAVIATNDTDFGRFPGVRTLNPLAAAG